MKAVFREKVLTPFEFAITLQRTDFSNVAIFANFATITFGSVQHCKSLLNPSLLSIPGRMPLLELFNLHLLPVNIIFYKYIHFLNRLHKYSRTFYSYFNDFRKMTVLFNNATCVDKSIVCSITFYLLSDLFWKIYLIPLFYYRKRTNFFLKVVLLGVANPFRYHSCHYKV